MSKDEVSKQFKPIFEQLDSMDNTICETFKVIEEDNDTTEITQKIILMLLYTRIRNGYKAAVLLFQNGLYLESATVIRSVVESYLVFNSNLAKPKEVLEILNNNSIVNVKRLHKNSLLYSQLKEKLDEYDFSGVNAHSKTIKDISYMCVLNKKFYEIYYKLLCDDVHVNLNSLELLLEMEGELVTKLKDNMDLKKFEQYLIVLVEVMEGVFHALYCFYNLPIVEHLKVTQEEMNQFYKP